MNEAEIETQNISDFFFKGDQILYFVHLMWQEFLVAVHFRLYTKQLEPKLSEKSYEMVSRFLFGLCNEHNLEMLLDCVEIEERNDATYRERFQQELKELAMAKLRRQRDTVNGFSRFCLPTLKWIREMGDSRFTAEAIKEAAACLDDVITIGGGGSFPILPTDVLDIIKVLNARVAELGLIVNGPSFVGNSSELFYEKLRTTLSEKCNIHVSTL